jgi:hypothetical protein
VVTSVTVNQTTKTEDIGADASRHRGVWGTQGASATRER